MGQALNNVPPVNNPPAVNNGAPAPAAASTIGGTLLKTLETIANEILVLRITTVIGDVTNGAVTEAADGSLQVAFNVAPTQVACTTINMALGNVTTVNSPQFADNAAYAKLHADSLALGRAVRTDTMDLLLKGVEAVKALAKL